MRRAAPLLLAVAFVALAAVCAAACPATASAGSAASLRPARLVLQWAPQAQFAGYYIAAAKGIYRKHGLDVEIVPGGPAVDAIAYLRDGRADFATAFLTGALAAGGAGAPLVDVCQVVNRSNLVVVAHRGTVDDVHDLDGRRVSLWGGSFRAAYLAFFKAAGVNPVLVPQYYTVNLFLRGGVVACVAMEYNELHTIIQCGIDRRRLTSIALRGTGFDFPEDGVYTLAATQRRDPDLCRRFAAATMAGWRYCRDHPAEALRIVMRRARAAHVPTNRAHQRWMLEHILASIFPQRPGAWRPGVLARADYERVCATLIDQRLIARAPAYGRFVAPEARGAP